MGSKTTPMILMMLAFVCATIPAAVTAALPPAIAQEETSLGEREDLANGIVSNVLDGGGDSDNDDEEEQEENDGDAGDDDGNTNTQIAVPITEQDQSDANLGINAAEQLGLNADILEEETPGSTPGGGLEPECSFEITADKEIYDPGDAVIITVTNTGDEPLDFPDAALGLQIKNVDNGKVFHIDAAQVVTTLEPGQTRIFPFPYELLRGVIGTGLISATVTSECGAKEVTFRLSEAVFCVELIPGGLACFNTEAECMQGSQIEFGGRDCIRFESRPLGAALCFIDEEDPGVPFVFCPP